MTPEQIAQNPGLRVCTVVENAPSVEERQAAFREALVRAGEDPSEAEGTSPIPAEIDRLICDAKAEAGYGDPGGFCPPSDTSATGR